MRITYYIKSSKGSNDEICVEIKKGSSTTHYAYAAWGEYDPGITVVTEIHEWEEKKLYQWILDKGYTYEPQTTV